jgi:hypothetical protein
MRNPSTIITFGQYSGLSLSNPAVPLSYIRWISKRGIYHEPGNRFEATFKVPIELMVLARREWESRTGLRWGE